jgi:hypothetical protein
MRPVFLDTEAQRRRAVAWVVDLTANTPLAPKRYERQLLARYESGELSIDQVIELLEVSTYQILYRSRATFPPSEAQLHELLEQSRRHNAAAGITGLLLYSDGRYVQVLEGPRDKVRALYARIREDPRHSHLVTVSEGPGPTRWFTQWSMGLGHVANSAAARALDTMLAQDLDPSTEVDYSLLRALLQAFRVTR